MFLSVKKSLQYQGVYLYYVDYVGYNTQEFTSTMYTTFKINSSAET